MLCDMFGDRERRIRQSDDFLGESAFGIVYQREMPSRIDSDDIRVTISLKIPKSDITINQFWKVSDHLSLAKATRHIQVEFEKSVTISDNDIIEPILIHIMMSIRRYTPMSTGSDLSTDTAIYPLILCSRSPTFDMCDRISEIYGHILMCPSRCFTDCITSSIREEHTIFIFPADTWCLGK